MMLIIRKILYYVSNVFGDLIENVPFGKIIYFLFHSMFKPISITTVIIYLCHLCIIISTLLFRMSFEGQPFK